MSRSRIQSSPSMKCSSCSHPLGETDNYCAQCGKQCLPPAPPISGKTYVLLLLAWGVGMFSVMAIGTYGRDLPNLLIGQVLLYISPSQAQPFLHPTYYCTTRKDWNDSIPDLVAGPCNCEATLEQCNKEKWLFGKKPAGQCYKQSCGMWVRSLVAEHNNVLIQHRVSQ